jgi:hypothetical protein
VVTSFGRYHDVLARCPDGHWRFESRVGELENRIPSREQLRLKIS